MLKIDYFDGFTLEIVSFEGIFDGEQVLVLARCYSSDIEFTLEVPKSDLNVGLALQVLSQMDASYELYIDDISSVVFHFEHDGASLERRFDGVKICKNAKTKNDKPVLTQLEKLVRVIRDEIILRARSAQSK